MLIEVKWPRTRLTHCSSSSLMPGTVFTHLLHRKVSSNGTWTLRQQVSYASENVRGCLQDHGRWASGNSTMSRFNCWLSIQVENVKKQMHRVYPSRPTFFSTNFFWCHCWWKTKKMETGRPMVWHLQPLATGQGMLYPTSRITCIVQLPLFFCCYLDSNKMAHSKKALLPTEVHRSCLLKQT